MSELSPPPTRTSFVDGIPPAAQKAGLLAGLVIAGALAGWIGRGVLAGPADVPTMQVFQDWRLDCPARKDKDAHCTLQTIMADPSSGQSIGSLAIVTEVDKDKKASRVAYVSVPLGVTALEAGLSVKVGSDVKSGSYRYCQENGCLATLPIDDKFTKSLVDTSDVAVNVSRLDNKVVAVPVSTKGYREAYKAYKNSEAKHASWWWRLWS